MRVAVLGMGHMGRAAARRLLEKGHDVTIWNRTPGRAREVVEKGATEAGSVRDAVRGAEVVITILTADAAVKAVALDGGAIDELGPDAVLVDMSTVYPDTSRELGQAVPGGRFVDAPILGGPEAFMEGRAKLLLGGRSEVVERLSSLWRDLSEGYTYTGPNGTATSLKLLSNLILVGGTQLLAEAVVTGQSLGITDDVLRAVFGSSPAVAPGARVRMEDIIGGDHQGWWSLILADKDISLVLKLAESVNKELPLATTTEESIRQAIDLGYGDLDLGAIVELIRKEQGRHP